MWSVRYRITSSRQAARPSKCRICRQETIRTHVVERKIVLILWLIRIPLGEEYFEICPACKARSRVIVDPELLDS
jgi:hypothetical protein